MNITSLDNQKVKKLKKLQSKKYRDIESEFVVEGEHLVLEAYKAGVLEEAFLLDGEENSYDFEVTYCSLEVMKKISSLDTFSKIVGLCKKKEMKEVLGAKILLLDGIQDPGNLGTIIRSSLAFNIDTIILTEDSVDLYNPKVLRATQGMIFNINIVVMTIDEVINYLKKSDITIYGTDVTGGVEAASLNQDEKKNFILIMGNEGSGVRREVSTLVDKNLYIPMNKKVESLNVGVATSILLYEMGR